VTNQFPGWPEGGTPSNIVSVIDGNTNTLAGNLTLGFNPADGVYDSDTGYLYISNYRSGTVSIVVPGHSPLLLASASGIPVTGTTPLTVQFAGSPAAEPPLTATYGISATELLPRLFRIHLTSTVKPAHTTLFSLLMTPRPRQPLQSK